MKKIICWLTFICFFLACPGTAILPSVLAAKFNKNKLIKLKKERIKRAKRAGWKPIAQDNYANIINAELANRTDNGPQSPFRIINKDASNDIAAFSANETGVLPPTDDDLAEVDGGSQFVKDFALKLGDNPAKVINGARRHIDFESYRGLRKGATETLKNRAGNSHDQANLVAGLLRYNGIPTRYITGKAKLTIAELMQWTGGKTPEAAINALHKRWISVTGINVFNPETQEYELDHVEFNHTWLSYFHNDIWVQADTSYKLYVVTQPADVDTTNSGNIDSLLNSVKLSGDSMSVDSSLIEDSLQSQLDYVVEKAEGLTMNRLLGSRRIIKTTPMEGYPGFVRYQYGSGPGELMLGFTKMPIMEWTPITESSFLPEEEKMKFKIIMPGGAEVTMNTSEISGKDLSIVYNENTPVFRIDGEAVITGTVGESTVKAGFLRPWQEWQYVSKKLAVGSRYSLGSHMQRISPEELKRQANELKEELASLGLSDDELAPEYIQDMEVSLLNKTYFTMHRKFVNDFSKSVEVDWTTEAALGFFSVSKDGGREIDMPLFVVNTLPLNMTADDHKEEVIKNWMITSGSIASSFEHLTIEAMFGVDAISTVKIFSEATKIGVPIIVLDNPATLETSLTKIEFREIDNSIKTLIRSYVNQGRTVIIPKQATTLGSWTGWGWLVAAPDYSSLGFQIHGGLNGGYATEPIRPVVATAIKVGVKVWETGDTFSATAAMAITAGTKAYAGYFVATELAGSSLAAVGTGIMVGQVVVATLLVVAGGIIFVTLLNSIWGSHSAIIRRWDDDTYYPFAYA